MRHYSLRVYQKRSLVHFAVDPREIYVTTFLDRHKTIFLPFNQGRNEGAGNPDNPNSSYRTSYLWERIWQKDIWLEIIGDFVYTKTTENFGLPPKHNIIFPRYHQLNTVLKLTEDTKKNGPGKRYLIQHWTGSGKSNTIAWLAYKLFSLHNDSTNPIFDTVIAISNRLGIVNQLGNAIKQFEPTPGIVEEVKTTSNLVRNLETERKILLVHNRNFLMF